MGLVEKYYTTAIASMADAAEKDTDTGRYIHRFRTVHPLVVRKPPFTDCVNWLALGSTSTTFIGAAAYIPRLIITPGSFVQVAVLLSPFKSAEMVWWIAERTEGIISAGRAQR